MVLKKKLITLTTMIPKGGH